MASREDGNGEGNKRSGRESKKDAKRARFKEDWMSRREPRPEADGPRAPRDPRPKRMYAFQLGYVGTGYSGLQKNPGVKTIEEEIEKAMFEAKCMSADNFGSLNKISWTRAGRTDKGVHAVCQTVGCKMMLTDESVEKTLDLINSHLPPEIRFFDAMRAVGSFNAKNHSSGRKYEYILPSWMLQANGLANSTLPDAEEDFKFDTSFRLSDDALAIANAVLKRYEGTHNFHNFTSGKKPTDESAKRYIWSFKCEERFQLGDHEFARLIVEGQSFMIHQIRKMIGTIVYILHFGLDPDEALGKSHSHDRIALPVAPSTGLMLNQVVYSRYNERFKDHVPIDTVRAKGKIDDFKSKMIYPEILKEVAAFSTWMHALKVQKELYMIEVTEVGTKRPEEDAGSD